MWTVEVFDDELLILLEPIVIVVPCDRTLLGKSMIGRDDELGLNITSELRRMTEWGESTYNNRSHCNAPRGYGFHAPRMGIPFWTGPLG